MQVKKDNYGFYINFTVYEADGETIRDLTGYTITFKVWDGDTLKSSGVCEIVVAGEGTCKYLVAETDFDTEGTYYGELELTTVSSRDDTDSFVITVLPTAP